MMKKTVKLDFPIKINGKDVAEMTYDASKISVEQFLQASMKSADMSKSQSFNFKLKENDYALHMYLGFMAVIAVNPDISLEDMERVSGADVLKFADIGMLFTYRKLGGASEDSSSDEQSETIPATSTQAEQTSEE